MKYNDKGKKIDVMIVGAQKSGTTSLKNYLGQHHDIMTHIQTEFSFFLKENEYDQGIDTAFKYYFGDPVRNGKKKVVCKSAAMYVNETSMRRLKAMNPECLIVLLLRDPVERAYSSYLMEVNSGWYHQPWSEIKHSLHKFQYGEKDKMFRLFVEMGLYAEQLKKIYRCFPKEQVLIFNFEDFKDDPAEICRDIFKRMGIDDSFVPDTSQRFNPAKRPLAKPLSKMVTWLRLNHNPVKRFLKFILPPSVFTPLGHWVTDIVSINHHTEPMNRELRRILSDFIKPYNESLEKMTGMNFQHWNFPEEKIPKKFISVTLPDELPEFHAGKRMPSPHPVDS